MTRIGIPYATEHFDLDQRGRIVGTYVNCPECGVRIDYLDRKDWESASGREYAEHYLAQHENGEQP